MIPPITDRLGRHWEQPNPKDIEIDATHALMSHESFEKLLDYSRSEPTGVYVGKMWRAQYRDGWFLHWFDFSDKPDCVMNRHRQILIG